MACCDHCGCFDDNHIDGDPNYKDLTDEQIEDDPDYEPHLYYYWHGDIQEDYQMPAGYDCLCECCFGTLLDTGHIITTDDSTWNPDTMGWFVPVDKVSTTAGNVPQLPL